MDLTTSLRSELAALQYKRDRLTSELEELKGQMRARDQRCLDLQVSKSSSKSSATQNCLFTYKVEADHLREQNARHNAIISSLKKRVHELEERERNLYAAQGKHEIAVQSLQRDLRYQEEKAKDLEKKLRSLELDLAAEEQKKEAARNAFQDFVRRLAVALGSDIAESTHFSPESLVHKASELVQVQMIYLPT